jgi:hypothetical protein
MWTCPKCREEVDSAFEICWQCGTTIDGLEDPTFVPEIEGEPPKYRPWIISPHPIGKRCPRCGDAKHSKVKAGSVVAFTNDHVCESCGLQYTPPTPLWAALCFLAVGLLLVLASALDFATKLALAWHGDHKAFVFLALDLFWIGLGALLIAYGAASKSNEHKEPTAL